MMMELCINFAKFLKFKLQNEYESIDLSREYSNYVNGSKDDDNRSESDKYFTSNNIVDFDKIYFEFLVSIPHKMTYDEYKILNRESIVEYSMFLIATNLV
jgi:hypothetical protein